MVRKKKLLARIDKYVLLQKGERFLKKRMEIYAT